MPIRIETASEEVKTKNLLEMGFDRQDCREALEAAGGDPVKALEILFASEARVFHKKMARQINSYFKKVALFAASLHQLFSSLFHACN